MRRSKEEMKKEGKEVTVGSSDADLYPWGLSITLEDESLNKLKLNPRDCKVGDTITIQCIAEISNLSESANARGKDRKTIGLQITQMGIQKTKGKGKFEEYSDQKNKGPGE